MFNAHFGGIFSILKLRQSGGFRTHRLLSFLGCRLSSHCSLNAGSGRLEWPAGTLRQRDTWDGAGGDLHGAGGDPLGPHAPEALLLHAGGRAAAEASWGRRGGRPAATTVRQTFCTRGHFSTKYKYVECRKQSKRPLWTG